MVDCRRPHRPLLRSLGWIAPLGAISLCAAAGCNASSTFEGKDKFVPMPTVRISYDLDRQDASDDPIALAKSERDLQLEVEGTQASGDFEDTDYDLTEVTGGARLRWMRYGNADVSLLGGVAFTDAQADPTGFGATSVDDQDVGPYIGLDVRYRSTDWLWAYARGQAAFLISDATSLRGEFGVDVRVFGPLDLLLGYRWWQYNLDRSDFISNDLDAQFDVRGIFFGLGIDL